MNYLILSSEFPPHSGGIGTCAYKLCRDILDQSFVLSAASRSNSKNGLDEKEANIIRSSGRGLFSRSFFFIYFILSIIKRYSIQKVIIFDHRSFLLFSIVNLFLDRKKRGIFYFGHGSEFIKTDLASSLFRLVLRRVDVTIMCNSQYTQGLIANTVGKESYVILLGGEKVTSNRIEDTAELDIIKSTYNKYNKVGLTVGRVDERKGQDLLINMVNERPDCFRDILFVLAGPVNEKFMSKFKSRIPENVLVLNEVDLITLEFIYANSDFYLQPSRFDSISEEVEGFGIAVCDAIHSGLIPIVSSHGGLREVLGSRLEQLVFEENSIESLCRVVRSVIELQEDEVDCFKRNLSHRALELSWEHSRTQFVRILRL